MTIGPSPFAGALLQFGSEGLLHTPILLRRALVVHLEGEAPYAGQEGQLQLDCFAEQ